MQYDIWIRSYSLCLDLWQCHNTNCDGKGPLWWTSDVTGFLGYFDTGFLVQGNPPIIFIVNMTMQPDYFDISIRHCVKKFIVIALWCHWFSRIFRISVSWFPEILFRDDSIHLYNTIFTFPIDSIVNGEKTIGGREAMQTGRRGMTFS